MAEDDYARNASSEKTIGDLWHDLVCARWFIFAGGLIGMAAAFLIGFVSMPQYKATMLIGPANPMNGAEVSSLLANDNLFALRHLVQRVGGANATDFLRFENIYHGPSIAAQLLQDENVHKGLAQDVRFRFARGKNERFSPALLAEYLQKRVTLEPVSGSTLRRFVYWHRNPAFAAYMLGRIHDLSDRHIRKSIREEAVQRVQYLQKAINETHNPEHRRALTTLLLEQERLRMLVSIDQPYAAMVIEPATAEADAGWPDYALLVPVCILLFSFLGFVIFSARRYRD